MFLRSIERNQWHKNGQRDHCQILILVLSEFKQIDSPPLPPEIIRISSLFPLKWSALIRLISFNI